MTLDNIGLVIDAYKKRTIYIVYHDKHGQQQISEAHEGSDLYEEHRKYIVLHYDKTIRVVPLNGITLYFKMLPRYLYTVIFPLIVPNEGTFVNIAWRNGPLLGMVKVMTSSLYKSFDYSMLKGFSRRATNVLLMDAQYNINCKEESNMKYEPHGCDNSKTISDVCPKLMMTIQQALEKVSESDVIAWLDAQLKDLNKSSSVEADMSKPAIAYEYNTETSTLTTWYRSTVPWYTEKFADDDGQLSTDDVVIGPPPVSMDESTFYDEILSKASHSQILRVNLNNIVVLNTNDYAFIAELADDQSHITFTATPKGTPKDIADNVLCEGFVYIVHSELSARKALMRSLDYLAANGSIVFSSMRKRIN